MVLTFVIFSINSCVTGVFQVVCLKKGQKINLNDEPCDAKHIYQNASEKGGSGKTNSMAVLSRTRSTVCTEPFFKKCERSPSEESRVHTDHPDLCCGGPQRPHRRSLKFSSSSR